MPKVSIHLVTWNGEKYIEECLNSVLEQTYKDWLLILIDNGSADRTIKIIEQEFAPLLGEKIRFVKNKNNLGFAKAHNQALLWTESDYVLVLNQDVILEKDFIAKMVDFMEDHKAAGSVSGKIMRWEFENKEELKNSVKSDTIDSLGLKIFKNQRVIELGAGIKDVGQYQKEMEIFGPSATCPIYRRQALDDVRFKDEFFDNDFFSYKEDVDMAYRLRWRGWQSFYLPQIIAYHDRSAAGLENPKNYEVLRMRKNKNKFINYHSYKNHLFLLYKNLSRSNFIHCFFNISYYEIKKFFYILFLEWPTLSGWKEFFSKRKAMKAKRNFIMSQRLVKEEDMRHWFN